MTDVFPIKATFKSGQGYDAPWLTLDATDPADLNTKIQGLLQADSVAAVIELANAFKAANNAAPLAPQGQEAQPPQQAAPQQQSPWGAPAAQQQAPQQQPQQNYGGGPQNGTLHPTGQQCQACGSVVQHKAFTSKAGKDFKMWTCPNQRSKGDGHYSEFIK